MERKIFHNRKNVELDVIAITPAKNGYNIQCSDGLTYIYSDFSKTIITLIGFNLTIYNFQQEVINFVKKYSNAISVSVSKSSLSTYITVGYFFTIRISDHYRPSSCVDISGLSLNDAIAKIESYAKENRIDSL